MRLKRGPSCPARSAGLAGIAEQAPGSRRLVWGRFAAADGPATRVCTRENHGERLRSTYRRAPLSAFVNTATVFLHHTLPQLVPVSPSQPSTFRPSPGTRDTQDPLHMLPTAGKLPAVHLASLSRTIGITHVLHRSLRKPQRFAKSRSFLPPLMERNAWRGAGTVHSMARAARSKADSFGRGGICDKQLRAMAVQVCSSSLFYSGAALAPKSQRNSPQITPV